MFAAVLAMVLGCAKDKSEPQQEVFKRTVKVSFTKGVDTKTALVEEEDMASYVWTEGDEEYFRITENGKVGSVTEIDYSADMKKISLTVEFDTEQADEYVYLAGFANSFSNKGNLVIPAEQSPGIVSYDPDAEVMYSDEIVSASPLTSLNFMLHRPITVNKMTLKGLVPGEKIKMVEISFDKSIAGYYIIYGDDAGTYSYGGKKLTLSYDDEVVPSDGTFDVYFTAAPVTDASFASVIVATDKYTYNKPTSAFSKKISFTIGKMTRFGMNMSGYSTPVVTADIYTLVENEDDLVSGETYIIAASDNNLAMGLYTGGNNHPQVNIEKDGNTITIDNSITVEPLLLEKNGSYWTIKNAAQNNTYSGKYLVAYTGSNNYLKEAASGNNRWDITISEGIASIVNANDDIERNTIFYNGNNKIFSCYLPTVLSPTGFYHTIALYKKDNSSPSTKPVISITSTNPMTVGKAGGSQTASFTITNPVSGQSLTAVSNDNDWITNVSVSGSNITFDVAAQASGASARMGSITLKYSGATSVNLIVNQDPGEGGSQIVTGWLELPAKTTGSDFFTSTLFAGNARNYTYMYQYSMYTCLWVAYPLYSSTMGSSEAIPGPYSPDPMEMASFEDRGKTWAANPQIDKSKQINVWSGSYGVSVPNANPSDIYARGHQIPNADRSNNGTMQSQTYYATNSTPQIQNRFNGYIWGKLEDGVRESVKDTVYVVTGACFRKVGGSESISYIQPQHDTKRAPVPNYYWKVLLKVKRSGGSITGALAIGFWYEHKQYTTQDYSNSAYVKSVDQIETWTGFDFFANLPENLQATAETNTNWSTFKSY